MKTHRSPILAAAWSALLWLLLLAVSTSAAGDAQALGEFLRLMRKGDVDVRFHTGKTLIRLGLEPADVVAVVAETLNDPRARDRAREAATDVAVRLGEMGEGTPLVPALARAIHDPNGFVSSGALRALQRIGPDAVLAMPELMKLMRQEPHQALSPIRGIGEGAIPYLLEGLESDLPAVRATCADALHNHGEHDEIRQPLIAVFADADAGVRERAVETARFIRRSTPELIDALVARLQDPEVRVVAAAVRALERTDASSAASAVRPLLQHEDPEIRSAASKTLRRMSAAGEPMQEETEAGLAAKLTDPVLDVRFEAAVTLAASAPDIPGLVDPLREGLRQGGRMLIDAITALGQLGPRGRAAAPELVGVVQRYTSVELIQSGAAQALGAMGPLPEHTGALTVLLPSAGDHLQVWLLYAITALDRNREDGLAGLVRRLDSEDSVVLQNAVHALGLLGPRAHAALPRLRQLLDSEDRALQALSQWAVQQIDSQEA